MENTEQEMHPAFRVVRNNVRQAIDRARAETDTAMQDLMHEFIWMDEEHKKQLRAEYSRGVKRGEENRMSAIQRIRDRIDAKVDHVVETMNFWRNR